MSFRFNPFTGTFESGLTFPDLATPPANTGLGSSGGLGYLGLQIGDIATQAADSISVGDVTAFGISIFGANGVDAVNGGQGNFISLNAGIATGTMGNGGIVGINAGTGGSVTGNGGLIALTAGTSYGTGNGGYFAAGGGDAVGIGEGGDVILASGNAFTAGSGGDWAATSGAGIGSGNHSGNFTFTIGSISDSATPGSFSVSGGPAVFGASVTATDFIWTGTKAANLVLAGPTTGSPAVPGFRSLVAADIPSLSATYAPANHSILSATHGDTTAASVVRGDVITGQGASPTWKRLAKGTANQVLAMDGTATDVLWVTPAAGGVTSIATTSPISGGTITATGTISLLVNTDHLFTASQSITKTINATSADGLLLTNTTAAAVGAQQWSPRLHLTGQGWKTTSTAASQAVDWIVEVQPVQGTTNPTSLLAFSGQVNGAGYTSLLTLSSDGVMAFANGTPTSRNSPGINLGSSGGNYIQGTNNGVIFSASDVAQFNVSAPNSMFVAKSSAIIGWASGTPDTNNPDVRLLRGGAATLQMGVDVNGAAVAQTFQSCRGITGTDKTGAPFHFVAGSGTGAATVSYIDFTTPTVTTSGTTQQAGVVRATISSASLNATVPIAFGGNLAISNAVPSISSGFGSGATIAGIAGGFRITCGTAPGVGGTVAFNATYANAPVCFVQDETTGILGIAAPTTTTVVISGLTLLSGQTVAVFVFGY